MTIRPPGPPNGALGLKHLTAMRADLLSHYVGLTKQFGDSVYYRVGPVRVFCFSHPDQLHEVFSAKAKSFHKPRRLRQVLGRWNGNGLLLNEGESWRRQRRLVQQAFHPAKVQSYGELFLRHARRLADDCRDREVNAFDHLSRLTLTAVAEALFGAETEPIAEEFTKAVGVLQEAAIADFLSPWITPLWFPTAGRRRLRAAMRLLDEFVTGVVTRRRAEGGNKNDLLSVLLAAVDEEGEQAGMTDRQVRDEAVNLLLGGNETTATALVWTLYLLARFPEEQQKLHDEIDRAVGQGPLTAEHAARLPQLEQALKESMRLYPPVYATSRTAIEPVEIGGFLVPKGAQVELPIYVTHHDQRWFPEPEQFRPQRFTATNEEQLPRCAYLPFGAGPRACVGKGFAMLEATLVLAAILQSLRIELPANHRPPVLEAQISLHPQGGMPLRFVSR